MRRRCNANKGIMDVIMEMKLKVREKKKWNWRWCVLRKTHTIGIGEVAIFVYKLTNRHGLKHGRLKDSFSLQDYLGYQSHVHIDSEIHVLVIFCFKNSIFLAFDASESLCLFTDKVCDYMGRVYEFPVVVTSAPAHSCVPLQLVRILIYKGRMTFIMHHPPKFLQSWNISDLSYYGLDGDGQFNFIEESGLYAVQTELAEELFEILRIRSGNALPTVSMVTNSSLNRLDATLGSINSINITSVKYDFPVNSNTNIGYCSKFHFPLKTCLAVIPAPSRSDSKPCYSRECSIMVDEMTKSCLATPVCEISFQVSLDGNRAWSVNYDVPPKRLSSSFVAYCESEDRSSTDTSNVDVLTFVESPLRSTHQGGTGSAGGWCAEYSVPRADVSLVGAAFVVQSSKDRRSLSLHHESDGGSSERYKVLPAIHQSFDHCCSTETMATNVAASVFAIDTIRGQGLFPFSAESALCAAESFGRKRCYDVSSTMPTHVSSCLSSCDVTRSLAEVLVTADMVAHLPYVNLERYDSGTESNFMYLLQTEESDCPADVSLPYVNADDRHDGVVDGIACPATDCCWTMIVSEPFSVFKDEEMALVAPNKPLPVTPPEYNDCIVDVDEAGETFKYGDLHDGHNLFPPSTFAPPVPFSSRSASQSCHSFTELVPTDISDQHTLNNIPRSSIQEDKYINIPALPPRCKITTAQLLPSNGPALLCRDKQEISHSSTPVLTAMPPIPPVRSWSLSLGSAQMFGESAKQPDHGCSANHLLKKPSPIGQFSRLGGNEGDMSMLRQIGERDDHATERLSFFSSFLQTRKVALPIMATSSPERSAVQSSGYIEMSRPLHYPTESSISNDDMPRTDTVVMRGAGDCASAGEEAIDDGCYMVMSTSSLSCGSMSGVIPATFSDSAKHCIRTLSPAGGDSIGELIAHPSTRHIGELGAACHEYESPRTFHTGNSVYFTGKMSSFDTEPNNAEVAGVTDSPCTAVPFADLRKFELVRCNSRFDEFVSSPQMPLPALPKKEGFFSRLLRRRNSKERENSYAPEGIYIKNRSSMFGRCMSERTSKPFTTADDHVTTTSMTRCRSASFPNRFNYKESKTETCTAHNNFCVKSVHLCTISSPAKSVKLTLASCMQSMSSVIRSVSAVTVLSGLSDSSSDRGIVDRHCRDLHHDDVRVTFSQCGFASRSYLHGNYCRGVKSAAQVYACSSDSLFIGSKSKLSVPLLSSIDPFRLAPYTFCGTDDEKIAMSTGKGEESVLSNADYDNVMVSDSLYHPVGVSTGYAGQTYPCCCSVHTGVDDPVKRGILLSCTGEKSCSHDSNPTRAISSLSLVLSCSSTDKDVEPFYVDMTKALLCPQKDLMKPSSYIVHIKRDKNNLHSPERWIDCE